jgi:hypothetical protein
VAVTGAEILQVTLTVLLSVLGVYVVAWAKGWGSASAAEALEEARAELARLTHASGLYTQRQHEVFSEVYQALRRARDNLVLVTEQHMTLRHDVKGMTREELREVLERWDDGEEGRVTGVRLLQANLPQAHWDAATDHLMSATNCYLSNALYFSNEGLAAVNALLSAIRHYKSAVAYGRQQVSNEELSERRKAIDDGLNRAFTLLRGELREPGGLKFEHTLKGPPPAEVFP